jgi:hypothetical protein
MKYFTPAELWAIEIAQKKSNSLSETMRSANDQLHITTNDKIEYIKPFNNVEIAYQSMLEVLQLSQRESDLIVISNFFEHAYRTLHNELQVRLTGSYGPFGRPSMHSVYILEKIYNLSKQYNLTNILLENFENYTLTDKQYTFLINTYNSGE